jgi:hypothetical protein
LSTTVEFARFDGEFPGTVAQQEQEAVVDVFFLLGFI